LSFDSLVESGIRGVLVIVSLNDRYTMYSTHTRRRHRTRNLIRQHGKTTIIPLSSEATSRNIAAVELDFITVSLPSGGIRLWSIDDGRFGRRSRT
jgi:hypothetical protein